MIFVAKEPINKGWSGDKKYCVTAENGVHYLLRVSDLTQYDAKQAEFKVMQQLAEMNIPMCKPNV